MSLMRQIVLASESPRRKLLLESIGIKFRTHPSNIDEESITVTDPYVLTKELSQLKAAEVARQYKNAIIIAADTVVLFKNQIFGKPKNVEDARAALKKLRGTTHKVITSCTILDTKSGRSFTDVSESGMMMKNISDELLERYIKSGEPMDKAGSYGYTGVGTILVERIEGDYYSEVGLPLGFVIEKLEELGVPVITP
jgi:septum formation protein